MIHVHDVLDRESCIVLAYGQSKFVEQRRFISTVRPFTPRQEHRRTSSYHAAKLNFILEVNPSFQLLSNYTMIRTEVLHNHTKCISSVDPARSFSIHYRLGIMLIKKMRTVQISLLSS